MLNKIVLFSVILLWIILHSYFFQVNEILKVADSFAYLQMADYAKSFDIRAFWNWWFWFLYSIIWVPFLHFIEDDFLAFKVFNIFCLIISSFLVFKISEKFLNFKYSIFSLVLFLISSTLIHYNIHILSENIYIPLFLWLFYLLLELEDKFTYKKIVWIWFLLSLLYFTRGEAFIYIWPVWLYII